ncbi:type II toxin-antitoxin system YafQ family toxin [Paludisphaera sp.]|uniref:type II toxin-antitoxin system YafQ family toxin n=1 Tax=Paludisphaera sp. TaxID=2017432 RepID=UPI00301BD1AE
MARKKPPPDPDPPPPLRLVPGTQFRRDVERQKARGKDLAKLADVVETIRARRPLDARHRDHALSGEWKGRRDCHVEPDWLLIYGVHGSELRLYRTGTHSDIFGR